MKISDSVLRSDEKAVFGLRELYGRYGYSQYKMGKFEEYDLYVRNKNFLISDHIITFNDQSGKLMALKPDVTLSIVKNMKDVSGYVNKVYYNENVYRVQKGGDSFREIMQVGLECMGAVGNKELTEVIYLAGRSLDLLAESNILEISKFLEEPTPFELYRTYSARFSIGCFQKSFPLSNIFLYLVSSAFLIFILQIVGYSS